MRQSPRKAVASPAVCVARLIAGAGLVLLLQACGTPQPAPPPPSPEAPVPAAPLEAAPPALVGRMTADAQEYPWSALGRVNLAGLGFCTGIVIGPQQVLTQARCLYNGRDGRWFKPNELHFIAAYQRDDYLANSPITDFTIAPGFNPQAGVSLGNLTNNWTLISLREPIGYKTGWLGLQWETTELQHARHYGQGAFLHAGYRSDRPHVVSLYFGCDEPTGAVDLCEATPPERALPPFFAIGDDLRVLADFYLTLPRQSDPLPRLTGYTLRDRRLGEGRPPIAGSVGRQPAATIEQLLEALGYPVTGGDVETAAAAFRRDQGLPPGQGADIALMSALLNAAWRAGP